MRCLQNARPFAVARAGSIGCAREILNRLPARTIGSPRHLSLRVVETEGTHESARGAVQPAWPLGCTALHLAAMGDHVAMLELLQEHGCLDGDTLEVQAQHAAAVVARLGNEGWNVCQRDGGRTKSALGGLLLDVDASGQTALMKAAKLGHLDVVKKLLSLGVSSTDLVSLRDPAGFSALSHAMTRLVQDDGASLPIVEELLRHGAQLFIGQKRHIASRANAKLRPDPVYAFVLWSRCGAGGTGAPASQQFLGRLRDAVQRFDKRARKLQEECADAGSADADSLASFFLRTPQSKWPMLLVRAPCCSRLWRSQCFLF